MKCPKCGGVLYEVRYPEGCMLNRDQFDAVRAGDWYCMICKGKQAASGYLYFWDLDLRQIGGAR